MSSKETNPSSFSLTSESVTSITPLQPQYRPNVTREMISKKFQRVFGSLPTPRKRDLSTTKKSADYEGSPPRNTKPKDFEASFGALSSSYGYGLASSYSQVSKAMTSTLVIALSRYHLLRIWCHAQELGDVILKFSIASLIGNTTVSCIIVYSQRVTAINL
ncbi:hypothetical protein C8Q75DRAFT_803000 [Abortiporus biennis]|nr:hypothetical protein C8Q75DRAFT_803000 [Abortiporus biennis]